MALYHGRGQRHHGSHGVCARWEKTQAKLSPAVTDAIPLGRPQAIQQKLRRDDPDRPMAEDFPTYMAAMVFRYLGLKMPECGFWT